MRLLIVSDTAIYRDKHENFLEVYEPTLREIESLNDLFLDITWLGYYKGSNPGNARKPYPKNIYLNTLPTVIGGNNFLKKFKVVPILPLLFLKIIRALRTHDVIHTRGPSVPAFVCILLSFVFRNKKYWHKYAGNWMEPHPPFMYKVQKWLLMRAKNTKVTINGKWPNQPAHVFTLENPCFTALELERAIVAGSHKSFVVPLTLCFAGLIDESKGVQALVRAFEYLDHPERYITKLILAGHGPGMEEVMKLAERISVQVEFTGYIQRQSLNEVYRQSHALLLPSRTEGFPKVVAEAASFGCIPIVTDVSSVGQYVRDGINGFLLKDAQPETIACALTRLLNTRNLHELSYEAKVMSGLFTYERFREVISNCVINQKS
ncbi:MAG: glycosyltransferase family 4 protein [Cyclobacteriaceae bacterium]|nr:MAG: glycosyltransferase family 4 protein [Cyclobacteriaceae bacterium]